MKTLNIDALAKPNRTLTLNGKTHEVMDMTVENFIETTKAAEKLGDNPSIVEQVESTVDLIIRTVPTVSPEELRRLSLEHLTTIIKFVRGELEEPAEAKAAPDAKGDKKTGKQ